MSTSATFEPIAAATHESTAAVTQIMHLFVNRPIFPWIMKTELVDNVLKSIHTTVREMKKAFVDIEATDIAPIPTTINGTYCNILARFSSDFTNPDKNGQYRKVLMRFTIDKSIIRINWQAGKATLSVTKMTDWTQALETFAEMFEISSDKTMQCDIANVIRNTDNMFPRTESVDLVTIKINNYLARIICESAISCAMILPSPDFANDRVHVWYK